MKKGKFVFLLIALCPLMSACNDKEHSVITINSYDNQNPFVELLPENISNLIENKQDFVLEIYSPTCQTCIELEPILEKYCKKQNRVVYRLNTHLISEDVYIDVLQEPYPDIFHNDYVPNILFISDGKLTYEVSPNKFGSYNGLKSVMNKHFTTSKITMINELSAFRTYVEKNDNYVCYFYNYEDQISIKFAASYIINEEIAKSKTPVVLLNQNTIGEESFEEVISYYLPDCASFACMVKNKEIIKTIDYASDDGSELIDLLASF